MPMHVMHSHLPSPCVSPFGIQKLCVCAILTHICQAQDPLAHSLLTIIDANIWPLGESGKGMSISN